MPLDPQAEAFLAREAALNLPDISEIGIAARYGGHAEVDVAGPVGDGAAIAHRFITTPTADLPVRIYTPKKSGPYSGFVYFHGGGWVLNHTDRYEAQLVDIAEKTNSVVLSINYQKSPEHKFPIPHDDCYAALKWMIENAAELNIDKNKIGVGGDSAGGNLAAGISLRARDEKVPLAYQLLIYPATKLDFDTDSYLNNADGYGLRRKGMMWFWDQYLNAGDKKNPYAVPDTAPDHKGLAPAIIPTAEYDVLRDDGISYAAR
ncbi:MAG: alpha/beta hydrolase [Actinomycetes bacterium]